MMVLKDLVKLIKENAGCSFTVGNDCWWLADADGIEICTSSDFVEVDHGIVGWSIYGGGILLALATIADVGIDSV